jgi:hypothetical protein
MSILGAAIIAGISTAALAAAVQWNEIPPPTGADAPAKFKDGGYRAEVIDIPIPGGDGDLEYKLQMKKGDTVVYSWEARDLASPDLLYVEFHGHTEPVNGRGDLMYYRKETGGRESGVFTAPWDGIHGWYLQNQSDKPITIRLRVAGFYTAIPGQAGTAVRE